LPIWNYDGSSTYQAEGSNSDVYLYPVTIYKDPFRRGNNILVLCDRFDGTPTESNKRNSCLETVNKCKDQEPWFGIEQEYTLLDVDMVSLEG
jgi:glutamine synthetase